MSAAKKCGFCWKFFYTGRKDYTNLIDFSGCAVLIFETIRTVHSTNTVNGEQTKTVTIDGFTGFSSHLSESFYNEKGEDCKENSRYVKYLRPLENCLNDYFPETICVDGFLYKRTSYTLDQRLNYLDTNLDGYSLRIIYSA